MVEKIKALCDKNGTTIKALEKELHIGNGSIRRWDDTAPSVDKVLLVSRYFGVTVEWLKNDTDEETPPTPEGEGRLSKEDAELFELIRSLPEDFRKREIAYLREYVNRSNTSSAHQEEEP